MQLKTLAKDNAEVVAMHLAMVARLVDDDPAAAHEHALAASRRAGRIGIVRETLAITAYQLGDFALALRELRTFRRITGSDEQLPMMVDCERGLGRPEKGLELARSVDATGLPTAVRVELAIARSGARLDLGQTQAALDELHIPELQPDVAHPYSPALFAAYATVLEELGRTDEATRWLDRTERAIDALEAAAAPGEIETVQVVEEDAPAGPGADAAAPDELGADELGADDAALDESALDDSALDESALDGSALDQSAPREAGEAERSSEDLMGSTAAVAGAEPDDALFSLDDLGATDPESTDRA